MKRFALMFLTNLALALALIPVSHAVEILHWERMPLAVPLIVGQERVIFIDRNVRVGVPASLRDHLRVQSAGGAIYLRANASIEPTRLQLQDESTGAIILLDIATQPATLDQTTLEPVRIVEDEVASTRPGRGDNATLERDLQLAQSSRSPETPVAVILTRYAAQSLYVPLRTVEPVNGLSRVTLRRGLVLDTLLPALPVRATALAAWRLDDEWVTAVRLTNTGAQWLALDPRALQGDFAAATFQHPDLGPAGESSDTSVLYLVTHGHGLAESLLPALSSIDAALNLPVESAAGRAHKGSREK
jgi:integrating conjugative element protein (TIGR03749 family)